MMMRYDWMGWMKMMEERIKMRMGMTTRDGWMRKMKRWKKREEKGVSGRRRRWSIIYTLNLPPKQQNKIYDE